MVGELGEGEAAGGSKFARILEGKEGGGRDSRRATRRDGFLALGIHARRVRRVSHGTAAGVVVQAVVERASVSGGVTFLFRVGD